MYQISIIEIVEPLNKASKNPWFRYVISNAQNTITGYRCGNKRDVQSFANDCITSLNQKYPPAKPYVFKPVQINVSYI